MKMKILLCIVMLLSSCADLATNKNREEEEKEVKRVDPKKKMANTVWYSREIKYSWEVEIPNNIVLTFSEDSVAFNLPGGDSFLAADLLGERGRLTKKRFTWDYSVDDKEIVLDPGWSGYDVHLEFSGDSLIWKGKLPVGCDYISLKRTGPVVRLK